MGNKCIINKKIRLQKNIIIKIINLLSLVLMLISDCKFYETLKKPKVFTNFKQEKITKFSNMILLECGKCLGKSVTKILRKNRKKNLLMLLRKNLNYFILL